jgi:uncharacterized phage protein gp47/JayE
MANLSLQSFTTMVQNASAAAQASCSQLIDFTVGSVLRAIMEAAATIALWLQWLILQVLALTRAATSQGSNLDTWMADFSFLRLAATDATGTVTLYRYTTGTVITVFAGGQVKTADGTQTFTILADPNNTTGFWSAGIQAYQANTSASSLNVLIQAVNAGTQGNVIAGAISLLSSSIPGIDYCANAAGITNGINAENDAAFRARFVLYINSLRQATLLAVQNAVAGMQQGLSSVIVVNAPSPGNVYAYIDDGSGATPSTTIAAVAAAVNAIRAIGSTAYVQQAPVTNASINIVFVSQAGQNHTTQIALISAAVSALVGALVVGAPLSYSALASAVYGVGGVASTSTLTINGVAADLAPGVSYGVVRLTAITVA